MTVVATWLAQRGGASRDLRASHPGRKVALGRLKPVGRRTPGKQIEDACNDPCPSGLMTGSYTRTAVAMEVLVELNVILPVRILLELL